MTADEIYYMQDESALMIQTLKVIPCRSSGGSVMVFGVGYVQT